MKKNYSGTLYIRFFIHTSTAMFSQEQPDPAARSQQLLHEFPVLYYRSLQLLMAIFVFFSTVPTTRCQTSVCIQPSQGRSLTTHGSPCRSYHSSRSSTGENWFLSTPTKWLTWPILSTQWVPGPFHSFVNIIGPIPFVFLLNHTTL